MGRITEAQKPTIHGCANHKYIKAPIILLQKRMLVHMKLQSLHNLDSKLLYDILYVVGTVLGLAAPALVNLTVT